MSSAMIPGLLVVISLIALVVAASSRAKRWLVGRPARVDILGGLLQVPRRYLVNVHDVVLRSPYIKSRETDTGQHTARMHQLAAGGFVASTVLILLVHLLGIGGWFLAVLLLVTLVVMAVGVGMLFQRRRPKQGLPQRLSKGGFNRLPFSLCAFILFFVITTLPAAGLTGPIAWDSLGGLALLAIGLWACLEMYLGMAVGPMKHSLNGILHLAYHPRKERFSDATAIDSALQPLQLDAPKLGVEKATDFRWNQLLGFDACIQCGRCEVACPAFAAGLPLNPKKLIQDLVAAQGAHGSDEGYTGSGYPGRPVGQARGGSDLPIVGEGAMIHADTLWSCTTCRACVYECPMMIEHVDAIVDMRRFQTLEMGATPNKAPAVLEELRATDTVGGKSVATRLDWAADLRLPVLADKKECDVLLWLGEGCYDMRNQRTLRAVVKLLRAAEVDFAVLGAEELDCGDVARRLGDEVTFVDLAKRNIATLAQYRFSRIVTSDPHIMHTVKNEYPAFGGRYDVLHHSTFLAQLLTEGKLKVGKLDTKSITFHDPCYLGRYNGETSAPRAVLNSIGVKVVEMEKSGMRSSCCGWGGGSTFTDIPGKRRIPDVRMDHVRETGAGIVAVACPNCAIMLEGVVQPRADVADVAELLASAVESRE